MFGLPVVLSYKMAEQNAIVKESINMQLSSPPKPTRVIKIHRPAVQSRVDAKSQVSTLPALAGEVALAQKNQMQELEKRLIVLKQVKV